MAQTINKDMVRTFEKNQQAIAKLNRQIEEAVGAQVTKKAELEKQNEDMKAAMLEAMEANDVDKFDGDLLTITRVKAGTRTTFDSTRFKDAMPKTYAKFLKTGTTKAYIKIKVKA